MKHADAFIVKLLINFPCMITGIILKQHPKVLHPQETLIKKVGPLTLDKMLFVGTCVPNIVLKHQDQTTDENSSPVSKAT